MGLALIAPISVLWVLYPSVSFLVFGLFIAVLTGYLDDRFNLSARIRLPLYFSALGVGMWPILSGYWSMGGYEIVIIAILVVTVGVVNTYNFMDGINGITTLYSAVNLLFIFVVFDAIDSHTSWVKPLTIATLTYLLVFGFFNLQKKAKAFLGDSGSVALGLIVCMLIIQLGIEIGSWQIIVLLAVYGVDSVGTIILRLLRKENIFEAHRSHLYQDLVHIKKWTHIQVALLYACIQGLINLVCYPFLLDGSVSIWMVVSTLVILAILYLYSKHKLNQLNFKTYS